jgi:uncharacterized Ntn-hydrolase superfamily protein
MKVYPEDGVQTPKRTPEQYERRADEMTFKATCYHLRRVKDGSKLVGGTLPKGLTLGQAAEWLTKESRLTVTPSGDVHYVYGTEPVWVYLSVDPRETPEGQALKREWLTEKRNREDREAELNRDRERELEDLVDEIGYDAAIEALRKLSE